MDDDDEQCSFDQCFEDDDGNIGARLDLGSLEEGEQSIIVEHNVPSELYSSDGYEFRWRVTHWSRSTKGKVYIQSHYLTDDAEMGAFIDKWYRLPGWKPIYLEKS